MTNPGMGLSQVRLHAAPPAALVPFQHMDTAAQANTRRSIESPQGTGAKPRLVPYAEEAFMPSSAPGDVGGPMHPPMEDRQRR